MTDNLKALLDKLPPFNSGWAQEVRIAWFQAYIALCRASMREES